MFGQLTTNLENEREEAKDSQTERAAFVKLPFVSVVVPCYNEEKHIGQVLSNLANQYPTESYEIIVVDGMSNDQTRQVISNFGNLHQSLQIKLVDNPERNIPTALNLGIKAAQGEIIARMDAHSVPSPNYISRGIELLNTTTAAVVGMPWQICAGAATTVAQAIALAVAHPFGIGDAKYRLQNSSAQFVDTVPFGVFRKSLWNELDGFNEKLLANEDYDFNYRVRQSGKKVLLDASAHSSYFARDTYSKLAKQYFRYGSWKAQMIKLHPRSIKLRQLVAPAFVTSTITVAVLSLFWKPALWLLMLIVLPYLALSLAISLQLSLKNINIKLLPALPIAFMTIHFFWGSGFLIGLCTSPAPPKL